jgi:hypothetical protein
MQRGDRKTVDASCEGAHITKTTQIEGNVKKNNARQGRVMKAVASDLPLRISSRID